jgi:DNA-binding MarR family transcriptional regulator
LQSRTIAGSFEPVTEAERLGEAIVRFVRSFGLHRPERTPCGFEAGVAEAHALGELDDEALRQGDLAGRLGLTKSTVSRLVTNLVDRGWAERHAVDHDGRGISVELTALGRNAARRLRRARIERMRSLLDAVPRERRRDAIEAFALLEEAARVSDPTHA